MKKLNVFFIGIVMLLFTACNMPQPNELGEKFETQQPMSIDDLLAELQTKPSVNNVQIQGTIYKSCMSEGCWFILKDKNGNEFYIDVKDKKFRLPNTSAGKDIIALVDASKKNDIDTTEAGAIDENEKYVLETRGLKFVEKSDLK